jgi:hypothetical protein
MGRATKRVVLMGDTHCGHEAGLTPAAFQVRWREAEKDEDNEDNAARLIRERENKAAALEHECWAWYVAACRRVQPVDLVIFNADAIDGRGERSGGTELLTADRGKQCDMAVTAIRKMGARRTMMTYGTPYHTGQIEDWEDNIADRLDAECIKSHLWVDVNGLIFDVKHHIGSSSVPYGRSTPITKDRVWNLIWAEHEQQPKANVIIRSHVHYFHGAFGTGWLGMTLPALQAAGTKYGARKCSGTVDFGFVVFDVKPSGNFSWYPEQPTLEHQKAHAIVV